MEQGKTSMGLEPNIAGLLCYALGWLSGLIFFFAEKDNKFVRFHALQSIIVSGCLTLFYIIMSSIQSALFTAAWRTYGGGGALLAFSGFIGLILTLFGLATFALWVFLMYKAYQNETFKLPIAGNIAEKQA